jgi:hypothetical protein
MKKLGLLQADLAVEEVDLSDVLGGQQPEVIYSGTGRDGRTGGWAHEYTIVYSDGSFRSIFRPAGPPPKPSNDTIPPAPRR